MTTSGMIEFSQSSETYSTETNLIPSPITAKWGMDSAGLVSVAFADSGEIQIKHRTKLRNNANFLFKIIPTFYNAMITFCAVIQNLLSLTACNNSKENTRRCTHPVFRGIHQF